MGSRWPNGGGSGTTYWLTSDGGPDGMGTDPQHGLPGRTRAEVRHRDPEREAHFIVSAADQAITVLAFDRAGRLYRRALDLEAHATLSRHQLLVKLGDALTNAGRGAEAARAYLEAVPGAQTGLGISPVINGRSRRARGSAIGTASSSRLV